MQINGQWIAKYSGTNKGIIVLDIDKLSDRYLAAATAWDDDLNRANFCTSFNLPLDEKSIKLDGIPITALDNSGKALTFEQIAKLEQQGYTIPKTADFQILLCEDTLEIQWKTPVATEGAGKTEFSKTRAGLPSEIRVIDDIRTWNEFKGYVSTLDRIFLFIAANPMPNGVCVQHFIEEAGQT